MCGIVGYSGSREASAVIMEGLHKLEYRGYDSAGIATLCDGQFQLRREVGKLRELDRCLEEGPVKGSCGIGHTRWATHGPPSHRNCHPHLDCSEGLAVVHNGIIENYSLLREELTEQGHVFTSQTDTEVVCHLIEQYYNGDLMEAVRKSLKHLKGAYALGIVSRNEPDIVVGARCGSPLIVGLGEREGFLASDVAAVLKYTSRVIYLEDEQVVRIRAGDCRVIDISGREVTPEVSAVDWDASTVEKGDYPHFMLKEISEQPQMVRDILARRLLPGEEEVNFKDVHLEEIDFLSTDKIHIVSCGTAWHASLVGKYLMEKFLRIPVEADIASEFRYRDPILDSSSVVIAVSQSGETADTLAGVNEARAKDAKVLGIINVVGSSIARDSDAVVYIYAGPEVAVASTKAYTAQLLSFYLLTVHLARKKGTISAAEAGKMLDEVRAIPEKMERILENKDAIEHCAEIYSKADDFLFLGRNLNLPSALEGALKLKEISYIHAEGCAAGEMKHGHIALVDEAMPVVCIVPESRVYEKMISNIQEIRARKGKIIAIATEGDKEIKQHADCLITIPRTAEELTPLLVALPMQLLAYYIAVRRGCDVDQPRNLAKSVTVE